MRSTIKYLLRMIWIRADQALTWAFRHSPRAARVITLRALARALDVTTISVEGEHGTMTGSPSDTAVFGEYLTTKAYSPGVVDLILDEFRRRGGTGTFVDIGANIGLTLRPVINAFPSVECIGFEPDPDNFELLRRNVGGPRDTEYPRLLNLALAASESEMLLERSSWNHGDHRLIGIDESGPERFAENERATVPVKAVPLDSQLDTADMKRPIVVKIDTQGAEPEVVEGGSRLLSEADMILIEFWPYGIRRRGRDVGDILSFSEKHFPKGAIIARDSEFERIHLTDIDLIVKRLREYDEAVGQGTDSVDLLLVR